MRLVEMLSANTRETRMKLYKIRNKITGRYSAGGRDEALDGKWFTARTLKLHIAQFINKTHWPENRYYFLSGYPNKPDYEIEVYEVTKIGVEDIQKQCDMIAAYRNIDEQRKHK